jgi:Serine dehydrogenase proteinase
MAVKPKSPTPAPGKKYAASIHPGTNISLPDEFVNAVRKIEVAVGRPALLCIQVPAPNSNRMESISEELVETFITNEELLPVDPICLIIHSAGGQARAAYRLALFLQRRCKAFTAVIPRFAKSAATMLALGADKIYIGSDSEIGPIDVQITDTDREERTSALDDTQAVEALHNAALEMADMVLILMQQRTRKKFQTLMPVVFHFVADVMRPLFRNIDTARYVQMSRSLKVGEEYVKRLLLTPRIDPKDRYTEAEATRIAQSLASEYPDHGFFINHTEARKIGLRIPENGPELAIALKLIYPMLAGFVTPSRGVSAIGCLKEISSTGGHP